LKEINMAQTDNLETRYPKKYQHVIDLMRRQRMTDQEISDVLRHLSPILTAPVTRATFIAAIALLWAPGEEVKS
jgi:hypothetical protein